MNVPEKRQRDLFNNHEGSRRNSRICFFQQHNHEAGWWQPVALLCLCLALVTVVNRRLIYYEKSMRCERKTV